MREVVDYGTARPGHGGAGMLIERSPPEDVCARVPELADQTDPVLVRWHRLLDDEGLSRQVRADLAGRSRLTLGHGRRRVPAAVILRRRVVQPRDAWSSQETVERVADALVRRSSGAGRLAKPATVSGAR